MSKKENKQTIHDRIGEIVQNLKAPKNQFNKFGNYKYRNAEDILNALKEVLQDEYVTLNDEIIMCGERYYIKATATLHSCGEEISAVAYARESENKKGMDSAQVTGATSSYARKYALNGLFMIDDVKDADNEDNSQQEGHEKAQVDKDDADLLIQAMKAFPDDSFLASVGQGLKKYGKFTDKQRDAVKDKVAQAEMVQPDFEEGDVIEPDDIEEDFNNYLERQK